MNEVTMSQEVYVSHKSVKVLPMTMAEYNNYRGWVLLNDEDGSDQGYLVEYLDGGKPNDTRHEGYISWTPKAQFDAGYTLEASGKTLSNISTESAKGNVPDIQTYGDPDAFILISKAWSKYENWMKSTKAMEINGVGCVIQVSTHSNGKVAEALTFVPGVKIIQNGLIGNDVCHELVSIL